MISCNDSSIQFEEGIDSSTLVIAFSGGGNRFLSTGSFMSVTGLENYHRICLRDPNALWYQGGVNDQHSSFQELCDYFRGKIKELDIEKILIIGNSSGGHVALLAAHHLKADYVHVFSPQTTIGLCSLFEASIKSYKSRIRNVITLYKKQWRNWKYFDLRRAMRTYNGKTKYFLHYAADNKYDRVRAERMEKIAGVRLFAYPYKNHGIVGPMRTSGYLQKLFTKEYIECPQKLFDVHYGNDIHKSPAGNIKVSSYKRIAHIIQTIAMSQPSLESICDSNDLVGELALDSSACLELVINLENVFGIHIEMDIMEFEDLKTVDNIFHLIKRSIKS